MSKTRIDLGWTDVSANESGFRVLRCVGKSCSNLVVVATLGSGATSWSDLTVQGNTTYRYRVDAYNAAGAASSSVVTVKTPER